MKEEVVPRCVKHLKFSCYLDDEDSKYSDFYQNLRYASKVEIQYIDGLEDNLNKIADIAEKNGGQCLYLNLWFSGQPDEEYSMDVAKNYVEVLRKFDKITTLKLTVEDEANFSNIIKIILDQPDFPWYNTVETVKCYEARDFKGQEDLKEFFTRLKNLKDFRGIFQSYFNPLEKFVTKQIRIPRINTTIPSEQEVRAKFFEFLQFNETKSLRIKCGPEQNT